MAISMTLKMIIVDDEELAITRLEKMLMQQISSELDIEIVGAFQYFEQAIEMAASHTIHVAMLDIEMPGMDGFELANQLIAIQPHIQIVFTTAFKDYAIQAFDINAIDYLLKPINKHRLELTLKRISTFSQSYQYPPTSGQKLQLGLFQKLHYIDEYGVEQLFPWKTLKAPELFAYLLLNRDKTVHKQILMDLLWPQYNLNKATTQLHTAIYQIRKVMKESGLNIEIKYKEGGYTLVLKGIDIDFQEWESAVQKAPPLSIDTLDLHLKIMKQYQGHLLEQSQYSWAMLEQERLQRIWLNHVQQIAELYRSEDNYFEALALYQQLVEKLPFVEAGYFGLMQINDILHFPIEVKKQYDLLCQRLLEAFDMTPSKKVMLWYEQWSVSVYI